MRQPRSWWTTIVGCLLLLLVDHPQAQTQALEDRVRKLEEQVEGEPARFNLPSWLSILRFKGDFRLRYQYDEETDSTARHRGRYRYRLSVEANVIKGLKVGFGIASGGDDPRSTNQTFQDSFSSKNIRIDLAFADYQPIEGIGIVAGKFNNPLWRPSDLLWDADIRPEGVSLYVDRPVLPPLQVFFVTGLFVIDEIGDGADPFVIPIQAGATLHATKQVVLRGAVTYYAFSHVQGNALDFSAGTNTLSGTVLAFDYDAVSLSGEIGLVKLLGTMIPYLGLFGEYVQNVDVDTDNEGFLVGTTLGYQNIAAPGQWQIQYLYRRLERDAWPDAFPDADVLNGATHVKGHKIAAVIGVLKQVTIGTAYYHTEEIGTNREQDVFQFDVNFKFP